MNEEAILTDIKDESVLAEAKLAEFAAGLSWGTLPSEVQQRAKLVVLDTVAHMLAGSREDPPRSFITTYPFAGRGRAKVIGTRRRTSAPIAGFLNGVTTTITQFDEGHLSSRSHPAIHVIPAALAVGEEMDASGEEFLEAVVAGYEVGAKVGMASGALRSGLHPHGMSGTIGAAVSVGKLLKFDVPKFRHLLDGISTLTLFPADDTTYAGATIHHCFVGVSVANAIQAALGVAAGLTGLEGCLTRYYLPKAGKNPDASLLAKELGTTYEICRNFFKIYPTCGHVSSPLEALRELKSAGPLDLAQIATIRVIIYKEATLLTERSPSNSLAAKFSIPYCIAVYLLTGQLDIDSFSPELLSDRSVRLLTEKVELQGSSNLVPAFPDGRPCRVELIMSDGSVRSASVKVPRGNYRNPISDAEVIEKAERLLRCASSKRRATILKKLFLELDRVRPLRMVTQYLS